MKEGWHLQYVDIKMENNFVHMTKNLQTLHLDLSDLVQGINFCFKPCDKRKEGFDWDTLRIFYQLRLHSFGSNQ